MKQVINQTFDEERALYGLKNVEVASCRFCGPADGESAMKECKDIRVRDCYFDLRYPFWHVTNAEIVDCEMTDKCRAALWYDKNVTIRNSKMGGIKALRECSRITLENDTVVSPEYLWRCKNVKVKDSSLESEYPFFECRDVEIDNLTMKAKYSFQYVRNVNITNSHFQTKDAFWHSKNVTVTDSVISGEYLGWYSENLKLIRCHIAGTQPLCYCKGLVLEDCTMEAADLAFERSQVHATVKGRIDSVKNPSEGSIRADSVGEIILEPEYIDPAKTKLVIGK